MVKPGKALNNPKNIASSRIKMEVTVNNYFEEYFLSTILAAIHQIDVLSRQ
jgi:hypothetical protein